jgi:hypothetical protein
VFFVVHVDLESVSCAGVGKCSYKQSNIIRHLLLVEDVMSSF